MFINQDVKLKTMLLYALISYENISKYMDLFLKTGVRVKGQVSEIIKFPIHINIDLELNFIFLGLVF